MSEENKKNLYPPLAPIQENQSTHGETPLLTRPLPPSYDQATSDDQPQAAQSTPAATTGPGEPDVVIVTQPAAVSPYGPSPVDVQCPYCHNYCRTRVRFRPNSRTHLIALLLCLFQLYCCVCVPYCIDSCMNATHYCGMCDRYLGTYQR